MPVRFGDFTLDEPRRQLWKGAAPVRVSPKALQLLAILVNERPRAVAKEDLYERLWPDTFVTEGNLATAVAEVRGALGDDFRSPRFIRTHYGFGYSFMAPVSEGDLPQPRPRRWIAPVLAIGITALVSVALAFWSRTFGQLPSPPPAAIRTIAVLPFDTSGAGRSDQHLGLGLADLVIARISGVRNLVVRPTTAVRGYAGRNVDIRETGRLLQVDAVLDGSVRTTPTRVRVTVQLLNIRDRTPIWAAQFDQKRTDMFVIEDAISQRIADALATRLTPNEKARLTKRYTANPEAYDLYIQACYQADKTIREDRLDTRSAIPLLRKAIEKDPYFALAWGRLAEIYAVNGAFNQSPPREMFENAKAAVDRALQLDDELSEAHCAAGVIKMYWDLDYAGAEREFIRTLRLNPRNTLAMMHYGRLLQCLGRFDEAIAMRKREIEADPLNPAVQSFLAAAYVTARRDDDGIRQCRLVLRMDPGFAFAHILLARLYAVRGEHEKAIAEAREAVRTDREGFQAKAMLGYTLGIAGKRSEAAVILHELESEPKAQPFDRAIVHLALGEREQFYELLEKAVDNRTYVLRLKTEPLFEGCRLEPRFQALLRRAGFPAAGPAVPMTLASSRP